MVKQLQLLKNYGLSVAVNRGCLRLKAILIDLDGTLLATSFETLMEGYMQGVASLFESWICQKEFIKAIMVSTDVMVNNSDPERTNMQVFADDFFTRTNLDPHLIKLFERYYIDEFPKLKSFAKADPSAQDMVELAFANNNKVVIATNPLLPLSAMIERLRWAGVADYPYALITHCDNMHFCKPNPRYYLEISKKINVPPENCLMIGDDLENDGSAALVGMDTFILKEGETLAAAIEYILSQRR